MSDDTTPTPNGVESHAGAPVENQEVPAEDKPSLENPVEVEPIEAEEDAPESPEEPQGIVTEDPKGPEEQAA